MQRFFAFVSPAALFLMFLGSATLSVALILSGVDLIFDVKVAAHAFVAVLAIWTLCGAPLMAAAALDPQTADWNAESRVRCAMISVFILVVGVIGIQVFQRMSLGPTLCMGFGLLLGGALTIALAEIGEAQWTCRTVHA